MSNRRRSPEVRKALEEIHVEFKVRAAERGARRQRRSILDIPLMLSRYAPRGQAIILNLADLPPLEDNAGQVGSE
jgi:hypothetical protein